MNQQADIAYPFTMEEWETCIRVLDQLKNDPLNNPDNETFKSLIGKIKRNSRKQLRKDSYAQKRVSDLETQKKAVIIDNALNGTSNYGLGHNDSEIKYRELNIPKNCYCCNNSFIKAHFFYNRICPDCAELNYNKRVQTGDLTDKTALVTGCRVKVGYATALKVLRNGASLIGTTRFPALALQEFKKENDYHEWKDRLTLYGLDLRDLKQIDVFIDYVKSKFSKLDILINNAAQTIRYPDNYYLPVISKETELLETYAHERLIPNATSVISDIKLLETEAVLELNDLPLTRFGQPVDNRDKTSWNSTLDEISLFELLEVNLINQIAPYHLIKAFKPLMLNCSGKDRYIINVTSSEGIFSYTNKTIFHPHTNMTKASLNMLTLTSGKDFADDDIYMNSVDVGWISTGAREELRKKQFEKGYIPPLDPVDGASRIMDPIFKGLTGERIFGKLLKDYIIHEW